MQLAAAALALLGVLGHRLDVAWLGVPGAIGLGAGACLLVIGPLARALARRMVAAERMAIATRLLDLAELLAPGSGVTEDKAVVRAMADIREGRVEQTVEALTAARDRTPGAEARLAIDERIAMLYLTANRWRDAIGHAEAHLFGAPPAAGDDGALRHALGFAAPVWVDLLGAYGRTGDLDRAAAMLARLEDVCAGRDAAAPWLHRGRMMFLALAGRPDAVRALVAPRQAGHMSRAARGYWLAVAHERCGDRATAAVSYTLAGAGPRGPRRGLMFQALAGLADARPVELSPAARDMVERIEAAPLPPQIRIARPARVRATWVLAAIVVAVSATTSIAVGDTADIGALLRAGALVHSVVASGEWWRLITCVFVHIGMLHLGLNALGLIVLGAIAEDLFGRARVVAIFGVAGIAGAVASYLASRGMLSAGASGGVLGLLGAVFVEITLHRARYRLAWKRGMWGALVVIAVGELGYDVLTPAMDQWAHGGGLAAGALLGMALSPTARWARVGAAAGRALAIGFAAAALIAGALAVRTSCLDSLARGGLVPVQVGDLVIHVPPGWPPPIASPSDGAPAPLDSAVYELHQPDGLVIVELSHRRGADVAAQLAVWLAEQGRRVKDELRSAEASGDDAGELIDTDVTPLIALPAGWDGRELIIVAPDDGLGHRQRVRVVVCGRAGAGGSVLAAIVVPETIAAAAPGFVAQLLASIEA
jgi:membrane associated rhomboid family serine protease